MQIGKKLSYYDKLLDKSFSFTSGLAHQGFLLLTRLPIH